MPLSSVIDWFCSMCASLTAGGDGCVQAYLNGQPCEESQLSMLACFLVYHSVPAPRHLPSIGLEGNCTSTSSFQYLYYPLMGLVSC